MGLSFSGGRAPLIVIESRNLGRFDAALVGYTFATLFCGFAGNPVQDFQCHPLDWAD
jgi:hypothetical protein